MRSPTARVLLTAVLFSWAGAASLQPAPQEPAPQARVILRPAIVKLGQKVTYRAEVIGWGVAGVSWLPPDSGAAFTWGTPRSGRTRPAPPIRKRFGPEARGPNKMIDYFNPDTAWVEIPLQVFELGVLKVPGIAFRFRPDPRPSPVMRAPTATLIVIPVLTPADSQATLRPVHGPLAAPWWERVPWRIVLAALALLAAAIALMVWLRRRRKVAVAPAGVPALSPMAAALAALAELRALRLAEQGRFAEHAFRLGQILRRYLEATVRTTRPGDTSPELVRHLQDAALEAEALSRLAGLLRGWDRVKFAREALTVEEALRSEMAVEGFLRRPQAAEPQPKVA